MAAGVIEPYDEDGVDAEVDSGYPEVGESVKARKYVVSHGPNIAVGTWVLPALPVENDGRLISVSSAVKRWRTQ